MEHNVHGSKLDRKDLSFFGVNAMLQQTSTGLDHAMVAFDLTQIIGQVTDHHSVITACRSGPKCRIHFRKLAPK